jgi:outer membrane lipoprotein-sorting protein
MRNALIASVLSVSFLAGCADAQPVSPAGPAPTTPAPDAKPALPADASVDQVLDALNDRGKDLSSFEGDVTLAETLAANGATTTHEGKVWYQVRPGDQGRIRVSFTMTTDPDGHRVKDRIEYILDNGTLIERNYSKKTQVTRPVIKPGEKINLLKLGEGPFPLPIGQDKNEVHKQFEVKKIDASKDDPSNIIHIQLSPLPGTRFARQFKTIDVWVDRNTHFPVRVDTMDSAETTERTTQLLNVKVNPQLTDKEFTLENIPAHGWNLVEEQFQD